MTVHLVTGHAGKIHVTSAEQAQYNAYVFGDGAYIINGCELTVVDNTTVHIAEGTMLVHGRHVTIKSGGDDISIAIGTVGKYRRDMICLKYTMDTSSGVEDMKLTVVQGEVSADGYVTPILGNQSILNGDNPCLIGLYTVDIDKLLNAGNIHRLCDEFTSYAQAFDGINTLNQRADAIVDAAHLNLTNIKDDADNKLSTISADLDSEVAVTRSEADVIIADTEGHLNEVKRQLEIDGYPTKQYVETVLNDFLANMNERLNSALSIVNDAKFVTLWEKDPELFFTGETITYDELQDKRKSWLTASEFYSLIANAKEYEEIEIDYYTINYSTGTSTIVNSIKENFRTFSGKLTSVLNLEKDSDGDVVIPIYAQRNSTNVNEDGTMVQAYRTNVRLVSRCVVSQIDSWPYSYSVVFSIGSSLYWKTTDDNTIPISVKAKDADSMVNDNGAAASTYTSFEGTASREFGNSSNSYPVVITRIRARKTIHG